MYFTWIKSNLVFMKDQVTKEIMDGLSKLVEGAFVLDQNPFYWIGKGDVNFEVAFSAKHTLRKGEVVQACIACKHRLRKLTSDCENTCKYESFIKSFPKKKITECLIHQGWEEKEPKAFYRSYFPINYNFSKLLERKKMNFFN